VAGSRAGAQRTQAISRRTVRGIESLKERKKERKNVITATGNDTSTSTKYHGHYEIRGRVDLGGRRRGRCTV
jgi:hypothetical protein